MGLSDRVQLLLINPAKEIKVEVAIELDTGQPGIFQGYRIQPNAARGALKGGCAIIRARWRRRTSRTN
jgi:glutamate dehydrogenase (NAD(P)+)